MAQRPSRGYDSRNSRLSGRPCPPAGAEAASLESLSGCPCLSVGAEMAEVALRLSGSPCSPVGVETALLVPPGLCGLLATTHPPCLPRCPVGAEVAVLQPLGLWLLPSGSPCLPLGTEVAEVGLKLSGSLCLSVGAEAALLVPPGLCCILATTRLSAAPCLHMGAEVAEVAVLQVVAPCLLLPTAQGGRCTTTTSSAGQTCVASTLPTILMCKTRVPRWCPWRVP